MPTRAAAETRARACTDASIPDGQLSAARAHLGWHASSAVPASAPSLHSDRTPRDVRRRAAACELGHTCASPTPTPPHPAAAPLAPTLTPPRPTAALPAPFLPCHVQWLHRLEVSITRGAEGKTGRAFVANMSDERAVELASKVASEGFIYGVRLPAGPGRACPPDATPPCCACSRMHRQPAILPPSVRVLLFHPPVNPLSQTQTAPKPTAGSVMSSGTPLIVHGPVLLRAQVAPLPQTPAASCPMPPARCVCPLPSTPAALPLARLPAQMGVALVVVELNRKNKEDAAKKVKEAAEKQANRELHERHLSTEKVGRAGGAGLRGWGAGRRGR